MTDDIAPHWWLVAWGTDYRKHALFNDETTANYFLQRCLFPDDKARVYPVITSQALHLALMALT